MDLFVDAVAIFVRVLIILMKVGVPIPTPRVLFVGLLPSSGPNAG